MRAAVVEAINEPLVVRDVADPECPADGAIIHVAANGICRTDWHLWTGDWAWRGLEIAPPFVLGLSLRRRLPRHRRPSRPARRRSRRRLRCRGGIGLSAVQIAVALGATVIAIDVKDDQLAAARELGAAHTIDASDTDPVEAVHQLTGPAERTSPSTHSASPRPA